MLLARRSLFRDRTRFLLSAGRTAGSLTAGPGGRARCYRTGQRHQPVVTKSPSDGEPETTCECAIRRA